MKECYWKENEEGMYEAECDNDRDFWLEWGLLRNFDFCPYCGKKLRKWA